MADTEFDIHYIARLARVELSAEEEERLGAQLAAVLQYVEKLKELDVEGIEPMAHPIPLVNVMRPDAVHPGLSHEEAMRNAPAEVSGLFSVPKIVE